MKIFEKIRKKIGYYVLRKHVAKLIRRRAYNNFSSARSVGVIFDATKQDLYLTSKAFIAFLTDKNIDVQGLGYVNNKDGLGWYAYHKNIEFFALDNSNWYFRPRAPFIAEFTEKPFDILIDLSSQENITIQFVLGLSKSLFKISKEYEKNYVDFILKVKEETNLDFFIQQLKHYLSSISKL